MNYYCKNHETCRGTSDGADRLCSPCREADRRRQEELQIEREYSRLTRKPIKPNTYREIERGRK